MEYLAMDYKNFCYRIVELFPDHFYNEGSYLYQKDIKGKFALTLYCDDLTYDRVQIETPAGHFCILYDNTVAKGIVFRSNIKYGNDTLIGLTSNINTVNIKNIFKAIE